jgi:hypothetical protein
VSRGSAKTREGVVGRLTHLRCFVIHPLGRLHPSLKSPIHTLSRLSMTSKLTLFRLRSELAKNGHLHEMHVCDNVGDHLQGNVYARYEWEAEASRAVQDLNTRWYAGKPLYAELSPVTDFKEACCRQNEMGECTRGG